MFGIGNDVPTIDIGINNAGVMNIQKRTSTEDGVELTMATNHVGHFLLTNLIMPKIIAAAKSSKKGSVRIVNLASIYSINENGGSIAQGKRRGRRPRAKVIEAVA